MCNPNKTTALLDMFQHPVFLVKDGSVMEVNHAAKAKNIKVNTPIADILPHGNDDYCAYTGGCLSLTVQVDGADYIATVLRTEDGDVFHLQELGDSPDLQVMALAAQQLRAPLAEVMNATEALANTETIQNQHQIGLINRGLFRILREIGNMSAISTYRKGRKFGKETRNIVAVIDEIMEKAQSLCNTTSDRLQYTADKGVIYCSVDVEMLERAVYNLISNALKFSLANSPVIVKLHHKNEKILFTVESQSFDNTLTQGNLFMRYIRDASVEDGRHGLGLGIPLTQCAAAAHNGALLMDHPNDSTIRFTLTLSTKSDRDPVLKAPFPNFDYMGGWDHSLVELSDVLPSTAFEKK